MGSRSHPSTSHDPAREPVPRWLSITGAELDLDLPNGLTGNCRSITEFKKLSAIGSGSYGIVYRALDTKSTQIIALKQMKISSRERTDGIPLMPLREIALLKSLRHPNIVRMKDVAVGRDLADLYMVLEYCEQDMAYLIDEVKMSFTFSEVKCLMKQLLEGIHYLHKTHIIHRDLKVANLLYHKGLLKIADFGMAREYISNHRPMTPTVVTIWYRPPEILLGCTRYTPAIDLWSAGCIMAELILLKPLLPGETAIEELDLIIQMLGRPDDKSWPKRILFPFHESLLEGDSGLRHRNFSPKASLEHRMMGQSHETIRLIKELLIWDPDKRLTAVEALKHKYFIEEPRAKPVSDMPPMPERKMEDFSSVQSPRDNSRSRSIRSRSRERKERIYHGRKENRETDRARAGKGKELAYGQTPPIPTGPAAMYAAGGAGGQYGANAHGGIPGLLFDFEEIGRDRAERGRRERGRSRDRYRDRSRDWDRERDRERKRPRNY